MNGYGCMKTMLRLWKNRGDYILAKFIQIYENNVEKYILTFKGQELTCTTVEDENGKVVQSGTLDTQFVNEFYNDFNDEDFDKIIDIINEIQFDNINRLGNLKQLENFK